jgi:hypothetical protein
LCPPEQREGVRRAFSVAFVSSSMPKAGTETWTNSIPRYALLTVTYCLSQKLVKVKEENQVKTLPVWQKAISLQKKELNDKYYEKEIHIHDCLPADLRQHGNSCSKHHS